MAIRSLDTLLRTALGLVLVPLLLFVYSLLAIALELAGVRPAPVHRLYTSFARVCLLLGGTRLVVHGVERLDREQADVVVPNHESGWDPLCILVALPRVVRRSVAKQQFMRIPVVGHALRRTGNIRVLCTQTQGDIERIHAGMGDRHPEVSILFFAERTRSHDGGLHAFKGAFARALGYGLPVLYRSALRGRDTSGSGGSCGGGAARWRSR